MIQKRLQPLLVVSALALASTQPAIGADISHEVREGRTGGFLEAGIGLAYDRVPLVAFVHDDFNESDDAQASLHIHLEGRLEWRNFFAETIDTSFSDLAIGYTAWADHDNTVEWVLSNQFSQYSPNEAAGFETLDDRDGDLTLGFRSLHQRDNITLQFELGHDIADSHNGIIAAALIGRSWQLRNWNAHALFGLRHFTDDVVDHYFGVSQSEATDTVAAYTAGSGTLASADIGAVVPINEKWLFRTNLTLDRLPDSVVASPLASGRMAYSVSAQFVYVF
jgi:outer membrane scaffolding protein for murein synthesis (MipA/OmpV family)